MAVHENEPEYMQSESRVQEPPGQGMQTARTYCSDQVSNPDDVPQDSPSSGNPWVDTPGRTPGQNPAINSRQILFLLLKSYYFISDDFLDRIVPIVGIKKKTLNNMINKLRELRSDREEEIRGLQERIYCQFYRCITFEKRLSAVQENSAHYAKMKSRVERARFRLTAMRKRLTGIRLNATNRQIAQVLGIPKGTVDSNLYMLKSRINLKT
jgi:hypothetical protein